MSALFQLFTRISLKDETHQRHCWERQDWKRLNSELIACDSLLLCLCKPVFAFALCRVVPPHVCKSLCISSFLLFEFSGPSVLFLVSIFSSLVCFLWVYILHYFPRNKAATFSFTFHLWVKHLGPILPHSSTWQLYMILHEKNGMLQLLNTELILLIIMIIA